MSNSITPQKTNCNKKIFKSLLIRLWPVCYGQYHFVNRIGGKILSFQKIFKKQWQDKKISFGFIQNWFWGLYPKRLFIYLTKSAWSFRNGLRRFPNGCRFMRGKVEGRKKKGDGKSKERKEKRKESNEKKRKKGNRKRLRGKVEGRKKKGKRKKQRRRAEKRENGGIKREKRNPEPQCSVER